METLSELVCEARDLIPKLDQWNCPNFLGKKEEKCVYCGKESIGHTPKFGNNFTSYDLLYSGEIVCPHCKQLADERQFYRRSMFLVTKDHFRQFKKAEGKSILLNPPEPPFALYFTRTWKKQGWIALMDKVNVDNHLFWAGFDYDTILINIDQCKDDFKLIEKLRELKISKEELRTGDFSMKSVEKLDGKISIIAEVQKRTGGMAWELEVFLNE